MRGRRRAKPPAGLDKIAIVGSPNVGKSVLFNVLTKKYVNVSNYPGTSVEVTRGTGKIYDKEYEIIDTPGMYSLMPITEEEKVARSILLNERPGLVIHVMDAKNLERMLSLTLQLIEASLPLILVLNIMDEAKREGILIDTARLEKELGLPVVETVSTTGKGIDDLKERIRDYGR
jgi:ferrous iron transport protein B